MANGHPRWYLFDYGMVISTAPTAEDWDTLEEATGIALRADSSAYWTHRRHFDAGDLTSEAYWSLVTGQTIQYGRATSSTPLTPTSGPTTTWTRWTSLNR